VSKQALDLALAVMPFGLCSIPTIGPATLKACMQAAGMSATVFSFNLEYLATLAPDPKRGWQLHDELGYLWDFLPGEWLFSAYDKDDERDRAYLNELAQEHVVPDYILELLGHLRPEADAFAEYCARRLIDSGAQIVGFTTSFMQTQASLAAAAHLKRMAPHIKVLFGGANCFGDMGPALLEAYPQIDVVAVGEADDTLPLVVQALKKGDIAGLSKIPGYAARVNGLIQTTKEFGPGVRMNDLPDPDFSDYFETKRQLESLLGPIPELPIYLPIETSRGCWWGAKSHCTFCGLNADRMEFRSKSPERAFGEFERQADRYGMTNFFAVDNIMDQSYYSTLLLDLSSSPKDYFVHYEIKANLKRPHIEAMRQAGVRKVQPGIEALDTDILKLMKKGISALQNVQTLKWLTEGDFAVSWFILTGFPGETLESYHKTLALVQRITHLTPPGNLAPVYIERFSPYQTRPAEFGISLTGHTKWYDFSFPGLSREQLGKIAYRFDYVDPNRDLQIDKLIDEELAPLVQKWKNSYRRNGPTLFLLNAIEGSALVAGPLNQPERILLISEELAEMLRACDACRPQKDVLLAGSIGTNWDELGARAVPELLMKAYLARFSDVVEDHCNHKDTPEALLGQMISNGLILREGERVLALPLHADCGRLELIVDPSTFKMSKQKALQV
jgi:ribosomal peptide maturation radical SAM protein 1